MNTYEPPLEPCCDFDPYEEWVHVDELDKYDDAEQFLKEVINHIYNTGNTNELENSLDELAGVFNLKLPNKEPKLTNKDELYGLNVRFITNTVNLSKIIGV